MNTKGFLGPIGDDLPSLMPIVIALLLFFTIFSLTLTSYNSKNFELRKNMSLIGISRELKGDSLILSTDQFTERCEFKKLDVQAYNYRVAIYENEKLVKLNTEGREIVSDFKEDFEDGDNFLRDELGKVYSCEFLRAGARELSSKKAKYLTRYYPVAVQTTLELNSDPGNKHIVISPAVMVMVIWE